MTEKTVQAKWFKYIIEIVTLTLILGFLVGVVVGFVRGWKYTSNGLFSLTIDTLRLGINESVLTVLILGVLYLVIFLALYRKIKHAKWSCLVSSAIVLFPVFIFLGYRINQLYVTGFFEPRAIVLNLIIGAGFILLWILVSIGIFWWTRWRILKTATVNTRVFGALLGVFLVFNVSMFLYHKYYEPESPNVIIILIDALRPDRLGCYGNSRNTSPNIDAFAEDSVLFTQAISQATFTKTSIASLFTSLYPYQHGVYGDTVDGTTSDILGEGETTLAEVLLRDGFSTAAWVHNPHLRSNMGFSQGFIEYDDRPAGMENINKRFSRWISQVGNKHKFFAYIHYLDLHDPYRPKPPYDTMYGVYSDVYSGIDFKNWGAYLAEIRENKRRLDKKDVDQLLAYYDGQLTYIDSQVGLLLEYLKREGLYDNSLIIITADHGDGFMEHGFISHSYKPYDELLRVPLIIKFPHSEYGGKVVNSQVRLIDVMPTILDILGVKTESKLSGLSLLGYVDDDGNKDRKVNFPDYSISEHNTRRISFVAIRTEKYKYIYYPDGEAEFYDLSADPKEQNNIMKMKPSEADGLHKMALSVAQNRKVGNTGKVVLDKKTVDELKALGYVQ